MSWSATSTCFLNISRDGESTTSLGCLFQCLTTLSVKKFFLISNLPIRGKRFVGRPGPSSFIYKAVANILCSKERRIETPCLVFYSYSSHTEKRENILDSFSNVTKEIIVIACIEVKDKHSLDEWGWFLWDFFFPFLFQRQVLPVTLLLNFAERRSAFADRRLKSNNTGVVQGKLMKVNNLWKLQALLLLKIR